VLVCWRLLSVSGEQVVSAYLCDYALNSKAVGMPVRLFVILVVCILHVLSTQEPYLNFMFVIDWRPSDFAVGRYVGPASALAMKAVENMQLLPGFNLSDWTIVDTQCNVMLIPEIVKRWKQLKNWKVHGVIGPSCSPCMSHTAVFTAFNIPQVRKFL